jgi:sigma-54 dependent transcriptional regulator, acetoin dehydrogenase operon transcriptional activator AcoR
MTALSRSRRDIEAAWRSFVVDGRTPDGVRPEIWRSWLRVRADQVDPGLRTCPRAPAADGAAAEEAFHLASRAVSHFGERLASGGHVVACFDAHGVMLAIQGNARTRRRLDDVNFAPGACWAEHAAGTNGPGTALVEARPLEVFASEHFVEAWQPWTCASAPVRFGGRILGVVDITSPWSARDPSLLLTAEALANAIESRLEADAAERRSALLLQVAQDALRAREDFLAVASHELKTPLTPLQLKIQKVQRLLARPGLDAGQLADALRGADRHIGRIVKFVDDLLDLSRVSREPLPLALEPTDLGATVRAVVERHRGDLERHGCAVAVTASREVVGRWDPARVADAFGHLLVNAMKYAPGRIDVEIDARPGAAQLRVRDRGPGIAPEDLERVFLPFERAVSCRNAAGFGLGLHAVRRIAEAHGGSARVESAPGRGSTFVVELPLTGAPGASE